MEELSRLKARMAHLRELQSLVRALRAMAATHVQEAQSSLSGVMSYVIAIEEAIAEGLGLLSDVEDFRPANGALGPRVLIAVCAEHGFVGALNERLLERVEAERDSDGPWALAIVGRRGSVLAAERALPVAWDFPMATGIGGVVGVTRKLADSLHAAGKARLVYATYRQGGNYEIAAKDILPLDPAIAVRARRRSPPLHHLPPAVLLQRLESEYLFAETTRAVVQSLASENAARLRVMEAADRKIGEKLETLGRRERVQRQEAITAELLDVITGSQAVLAQQEAWKARLCDG